MCSDNTKNPTGGVCLGRVVTGQNPDQDLLERILEPANLKLAWKRVKENKGSSGVDKVTIEEFPAYARDRWQEIRTALLQGSYVPSPVRRVEIPKATGGTRPLGIPTVLDRVIQQAIYQVLMPVFEPKFSDSSFGFRPGRSAHDAVYQVKGYITEGYKTAVDVDLSKFFDKVNHDVLMNRLSRHVGDRRILKLIGKYLRAGVMVDGRLQATNKGVPQGGPLSPLLANIILDDLDKELEKRGHRFARYADDFIILVGGRRSGKRVMESIEKFLEQRLKLEINREKSKVADISECTFLGFIFKGKKVRWSDKAFVEFKRRVKELTGRSWGVSMTYRMEKLTEYIRGWMNYFGISEYYRPIPPLEEWLRRRIRMCYWKQWRRCRTKVRELLKLGASINTAISAGLSRKGYWRNARTLATQSGMTNKWLKEQGLISIKEQWVRIHYPATAR